jgi:hypothetical protein
MSDPSALRLKLFIVLFILLLLIAFINGKVLKKSARKLEAKNIKILNVIGVFGLTCFIILIIRTWLK